MASLIQLKGGKEGEIFCKWLYSRLIKNNQNVLSAELGATGSGKSYRDLRKAELWYKYHFKKEFPTENICFGLGQAMERLSSGQLKKGEILIIEEAGVNLGSRDWQNKFSKMFNYVLQSFRSMNIGLFLNLPYLSMLDSQARHLLHYYAESVTIDREKKLNKCKPFFLQVAQGTGKIYNHYPKVKIDGRVVKVKRFNYSMPSQYLIDAYEEKKQKYLNELIKGFSEKVNGKEKDNRPSDLAFKCYYEHKAGKPQPEIAEEVGKSQQLVSVYFRKVKKYLNFIENEGNSGGIEVQQTTDTTETIPNLTIQ